MRQNGLAILTIALQGTCHRRQAIANCAAATDFAKMGNAVASFEAVDLSQLNSNSDGQDRPDLFDNVWQIAL